MKGNLVIIMKRSLAIIIMSMMLIGLYPIPAAASDNAAVYVKTGGTGDGTSALSPLGSLADAYNKLGGAGGTIVFCGAVTLTAAFTAPPHSGAVTLTGAYGGDDYRKGGGSLTFESSLLRYTLGGDTVFKDLNIGCNSVADYPTAVINSRFNSITFDSGCEMTHPGHRIYLVGGNQDAAGGYDKDSRINLKSGRFHLISGFSRTVKNQTFTGTAYIDLSGSVNVTNLYIGSVNGSDAGSAFVNISENAKVAAFYLSGDMGVMNGDVTILVNGGYIKNFSRITFVKGDITLAYDPEKAQPEITKMARLASFNRIVSISEFNGGTAAPPDTDIPAAANDVVFVSNGGTGTGKTPLYPTDDLEYAFNKLADTGGTIVICGKYTLPLNLSYTKNSLKAFAEPAHTGEITLTSVYGGTDYRTQNSAALIFDGNTHYRLAGSTVFKNIDFDATKGTSGNVIAACYNPVVFDEGCRMLKYDDPSVDYKLHLVGGYQYYTYVDVAGNRYEGDKDGYLRVTNRSDRIENSKNQVIDDLITIPGHTKTMRKEPALALVSMLDALVAAGLRRPAINEAFRTHERQHEIFTIFVAKRMDAGLSYDEAYRITEDGVADPDSSDHRLGLAADIFHLDMGNNSFYKTPEYAWLLLHAHEYGYIIHYMENKTVQTGAIFESWHYRYVGLEHAAAIKESGMCLEEYVGYLCGDFDLDSSVTVKSGTFSVVSGGSRNTEGLAFTGSTKIDISGTALITEGVWAGTVNSGDSPVGSASVSISSGAVKNVYCSYGQSTGGGITGGCVLTITGGEIDGIYAQKVSGQSVLNYDPAGAQGNLLDKISGSFTEINKIAAAEDAKTEDGDPQAETSAAQSTAEGGDKLPFTGSKLASIGILALILLAIGAVLAIILRKNGSAG